MFKGFTDETVDFMWGIRFNNEKPWFEAHKEEYLTHFYRPMRELGDELPGGSRNNGRTFLCEAGFPTSIGMPAAPQARAHKDNLWLSVSSAESVWTSQPTFWFELGPEEWSYGLGYYSATPATMMKLMPMAWTLR